MPRECRFTPSPSVPSALSTHTVDRSVYRTSSTTTYGYLWAGTWSKQQFGTSVSGPTAVFLFGRVLRLTDSRSDRRHRDSRSHLGRARRDLQRCSPSRCFQGDKEARCAGRRQCPGREVGAGYLDFWNYQCDSVSIITNKVFGSLSVSGLV